MFSNPFPIHPRIIYSTQATATSTPPERCLRPIPPLPPQSADGDFTPLSASDARRRASTSGVLSSMFDAGLEEKLAFVGLNEHF